MAKISLDLKEKSRTVQHSFNDGAGLKLQARRLGNVDYSATLEVVL
jgi:hypothetical protein